MGSFLSSILTGQNPTLNGDIGNAGNVAGFGIGTGEGAVQSGLGFQEGLLSGNQAEEAKLLAPEISNIQKQGQQQINTAAQFGNRAGGTNASAQNNIDTQRSGITDMIAKLTGNAANSVTSTGEGLLNTGLNANQQQAQESQDKLKNFQDSVLGSGVSDVAATGLNAAEGALGF